MEVKVQDILPQVDLRKLPKFLKKIRGMSDIDINRLEEEAQNHWKIVLLMGEYVAAGKAELAYVEGLLEVAEADAKNAVRRNPAKFGLEKATDGGVREVYVKSRRYQEATEEVRKAKHLVDHLTGMMTALDHRKRMIEGLIQLHGQQYFSAVRPRAGKAIKP